MSAGGFNSSNLLSEKKISSEKIKSMHKGKDSENRQKSGSKIPVDLAMRNPLADICENILPGKKIASTRKVHKSNVVVEVKQIKPSASHDKQTKITYSKKSENVTERQNLEEAVKISDEVFVEGEEHYLNYLPQNKFPDVCKPTSSKAKSEDLEVQIEKPLPVIRINGPCSERTEIKKPSQKVTLVKKLSSRCRRPKEDTFYNDALYNEEYFKDNYSYMLKTERYFVFRKDLMRKYINEDYRRVIVNWLIYVQQILGLTEATFFMGIRIYDSVLVSANLSSRNYLLAGVTCLWIASKLVDVQYIQIPKLFSLCNGKYSKQEILSMEQEILKLLKFNVNVPEPATFLYYYLDQQNLQNNLKIRYSATFLLEVFALLLDFSSLTPSILACLSLHLVLLKYNLDSALFLDFIDCHLLDKETFLKKSKEFGCYVEQLLSFKVTNKEVLAKYSKENKCCVALEFVPK